MDFAHHNMNSQHLNWTYSYDYLEERYYWPRMKRDMRRYAERCKVCQFSKGSIRHRGPLQIRTLPKPREHIMCDFIGPIFQPYGLNYYILVIIDYATGWSMLVPTEGCDAVTVVETLVHKWIPLMGQPLTIETDYGSGFDSHIYRTLMRSLGIKWEYAERSNHRSIGKVERVIGFIQNIIKRYNLQLDTEITDPSHDDYEEAWNIIKIILPHIQVTINQRRPRFTTYSPNMLMFGSQLHDVGDVNRILRKIRNHKRVQNDISDADQAYLIDLISTLKQIYDNYNKDYIKYVKLSTERYTRKWRLTNIKKRDRYNVGVKVLYYIGDRQTVNKKWLSQWTGPWTIKTKLNDMTRIIEDEDTGNQLRVSIDRLRLFNSKTEYIKYTTNEIDEEFAAYDKRVQEKLYKYNVRTNKQHINLDFRSNNQIQ